MDTELFKEWFQAFTQAVGLIFMLKIFMGKQSSYYRDLVSKA